MALDAYSPCPCGSGKKFKFCCAEVADEMEKVTRLAENNQPHVALQILDRLAKDHPQAAWVYTARASILFQERQYPEARNTLQALLEKQPEHSFAISLLATATLAADGWPAAKPAVYRALQKGSASEPGLTSSLSLALASLMYGAEKHLACRQHLALAMRLAPQQDQQEIFLRLLQFDGDVQIFFPLRSVHLLAPCSPAAEDAQKDLRKAARLAELGCFDPAARLFAKVAEQEGERAELLHNVGLCRAWDGDEVRAAEALHRAARLYGDAEQAVECETLAQLLDLNRSEEHIRVVTELYVVPSVGRLLTRLDENDRFARVHMPPPEDPDEQPPAAIFQLLDRPAAVWDRERSWQPQDIPVVIGQLIIYDEDPREELPARAVLTGFEDGELEAARELLKGAAGDGIEPEPAPQDDLTIESIPRELRALHWRWRFPEEMPILEQRRVEREQWQRVIADVWPNLKLSALGGKSPRERAADESLRLPLRASVHVFDALCDRNRFHLDLNAVCRELGIDEPRPIEVREKLPLQNFSALQLIRLPVAPLDDGQLMQTLNRALLIHHGRFLYEVLTEALRRPACHEKVDLNRAYRTMLELSREQFRREEALQWAAKGREHARSAEKPFEAGLQWAMTELSLRLEEPDDPGLRSLLQHLVQYYVPKLPQLQRHLEGLLAYYRVPISLEELGGVPVGATTAGGLWTPGASESTPEGGRKLWVPGQD